MALAAFVEDINSVGEAFRSEYVQDESLGGYRLDVSEAKGFVLENTEALKGALNKERKARSDYEKQYNSLKTKLGDLDVDSAREAMEKLAQFEQFDPKTEADKLAQEKYEANKKRLETQLNKQWEAKINSEYEPIKQKYGLVEEQLKRELVNGAALAAISAENGDIDLLLPHVMSKIKFAMNDSGKFETTVVDGNGEPMYNNKGQVMSARELVASMKTKFPAAFKSEARPGGGTPNNPGANTRQPADNSFAEALRNAAPGGRII